MPKRSRIRRSVYTVYLNALLEPRRQINRQFRVFDAFPTLLSSIGVMIEGDRLGLGTDLFSDRKTLTEEMGEEQLTQALRKRSAYMVEESAR